LTKTITKNVEPNALVSQAEAARIRGVSKQAIANLIARKRLETVVIAGRTLLYRSDVEAFVPLPKTGRPSKKSPDKKASKRIQSKK